MCFRQLIKFFAHIVNRLFEKLLRVFGLICVSGDRRWNASQWLATFKFDLARQLQLRVDV